MSEAGSAYPLLRKGERVTEDLAAEAYRRVTITGSREVLIRTTGDWNNASTMKSRMEASKAFESYRPELRWFCQRIGPDSIGVYVGPVDV